MKVWDRDASHGNWCTRPGRARRGTIIGFVADDQTRDALRTGFDRAAEDYQRTRPVCPPQLFGDLIDLAGLEAGDRVLEIGCGTGQATVPLAEHGLAITAVELGPSWQPSPAVDWLGFVLPKW